MCNLLALRTPIEVNKVLYLEADLNYTTVVFTNGRQLVLSKTIAHLFAGMPETLFVRISKTHVVNVGYVRLMSLKRQQRYVRLSTGQKFEVSRRRATELRKNQRENLNENR